MIKLRETPKAKCYQAVCENIPWPGETSLGMVKKRWMKQWAIRSQAPLFCYAKDEEKVQRLNGYGLSMMD
jgi:hypothetical protein